MESAGRARWPSGGQFLVGSLISASMERGAVTGPPNPAKSPRIGYPPVTRLRLPHCRTAAGFELEAACQFEGAPPDGSPKSSEVLMNSSSVRSRSILMSSQAHDQQASAPMLDTVPTASQQVRLLMAAAAPFDINDR